MLTEIFIDNYKFKLTLGLSHVNTQTFNDVVTLLTNCHKARGKVFVAGNGGSAAISEHFSCDHSKGVSTNTYYFPQIINLTSNVSLFTAYANDNGYEKTFSLQLVNFADKGDVLVVISSSGNSPNVIEAIDAAHTLGMKVVAFTGFDGGKAKQKADYNFHIPVDNYGVVEDCHQIIMHMLAQYIRTTDTVVDMAKVRL